MQARDNQPAPASYGKTQLKPASKHHRTACILVWLVVGGIFACACLGPLVEAW